MPGTSGRRATSGRAPSTTPSAATWSGSDAAIGLGRCRPSFCEAPDEEVARSAFEAARAIDARRRRQHDQDQQERLHGTRSLRGGAGVLPPRRCASPRGQPAVFQADDAVGEGEDPVVVRDDHQRHAAVADQAGEQVA